MELSSEDTAGSAESEVSARQVSSFPFFFFSRLFLIRLIPLLPLFYNMLLFIIESFVFSLRNRAGPDVIE